MCLPCVTFGETREGEKMDLSRLSCGCRFSDGILLIDFDALLLFLFGINRGSVKRGVVL